MLESGTCCGCLSLRRECIVFGLVDLITQIPHIAVDVGVDGYVAFVDLIVVIIGTLLSGLLVCGALLRNVLCLWVWIFVHIIRTLLFTIGVILCVIALTVDVKTSNIAATIHAEFEDMEIELLMGLFIMNIVVYICLMVMVCRYICQLLDEFEYEEGGGESIAETHFTHGASVPKT